ncbi:MAG: class I mannose-6-phosphate isomerase [Novosphingobium sp.]
MSALLPLREVAKPWGRRTLPAPFDAEKPEKIGEVWFEPPPALDRLLVKYIFTSEALSVQVHPSDLQTQAAGLGRQGKEECWLVIDAEPDAVLGIGFEAHVEAEALRAAALDGSIERLMTWHPVARGDFFYIPANTVHAIGAGISLIEVQQNSDITYRLYDYGRPRELHLEQGVEVALGESYPPSLHYRLAEHGNAQLVDGPCFRLDRVAGKPDVATRAHYGIGPLLVIPLTGEVRIDGEAIAPGGCGLARGVDAVEFAEDGLSLITQPTT